MIVAFDSDIWSWQVAGGICRYFVALGKALETLRHQVDVRAPVHVNGWLREWKPANGIYLSNHLTNLGPARSFRHYFAGSIAGLRTSRLGSRTLYITRPGI